MKKSSFNLSQPSCPKFLVNSSCFSKSSILTDFFDFYKAAKQSSNVTSYNFNSLPLNSIIDIYFAPYSEGAHASYYGPSAPYPTTLKYSASLHLLNGSYTASLTKTLISEPEYPSVLSAKIS